MITRNEFHVYNEIKTSGLHDMSDIQLVSWMTGLDKEQIYWLENNYDQLKKQWG